MASLEHYPGDDQAPRSRHYEEQNVLGSPTGKVVYVNEGEELPVVHGASRGATSGERTAEMEQRRPLPYQLTREQQLARAAEYWAMAAEAGTPDMRVALTRLAERYEGLAERPD